MVAKKVINKDFGVDIHFTLEDGRDFVKFYVGQGDSLEELKKEVREPYLTEALEYLATIEYEPIDGLQDDSQLTEAERIERLELARIKAAELTVKMDQELDELLIAQLGGSDG